MYFAVVLRYSASVEDRDANKPAHKSYLKAVFDSGKLVVGGPFTSGIGGLLLFSVDDQKELDAIVKEEPFYKLGFYTYEAWEWGPTLGKDGFAEIAKR
jgi:uncharacterized protein YciI